MIASAQRSGPGRLLRGAVAAAGALTLVASPLQGAVAANGVAPPMSGEADAVEAELMSRNFTVPPTYGQVFEAYVADGDNLDLSGVVDTNRTTGEFTGEFVRVVVTDAAGNEVHNVDYPVDAPGDTFSAFNLTGAGGVWKVDISSFRTDSAGNLVNDTSTVFDWIINPQTGNTTHSGRVWAAERTDTTGLSLYRAQQPDFDAGLVDTAMDVSAFFLSDTGVVYEGTYNDYQGFTSYIGADSLGLGDSNCNPAYTSAYGAASTSASLTPGGPADFRLAGTDCTDAVVYRTFFEEPDSSMPATAPSYRGNTWVYNEYEGPDFPSLTGSVPGEDTYADTVITYELTGQPGLVTIEIDTTGTGDFDDPLQFEQLSTVGENTFTWDGSDVDRSEQVHVRVYIEQTGEIHFLNIDVENRSGGLQIEQLTGPGAGMSDLYWDDTAINGTPPNSCADLGDQEPEGTMCYVPNPRSTDTLVGNGVNSSGGVHGWAAPNNPDSPTGPWGNVRVIDDWTFIEDSAESEIVLLPVLAEPDPDLRINKEQDGEPVISEDGTTATITWTVEAGNLGEGPAGDVEVVDTLPDEADASTLAVVDGPSQGEFDTSSATWAVGDLAPGQTETVTLSADVALSGDPQVFVNQARIGNPGFPAPGPGEPCQVNSDLPGDEDRCDEVETPIDLDPSLAINKEQVGEAVINDDSTATITWLIEAGNFGPANADDVTVTDTLPEDVDPATVEVVEGPSQGEFDTESATWTVGDLDRGQTETLTLSATVPLNGDEQVFVNQARIGNPEFPPPPVEEPCVPNDNLAGDDDQCDEVETPVDPDPELKVNKENVGEPVISENGSTATVTWLIEAGNTGVGNADDVTVTDTLPEQVNPASVQVVEGPSQGDFDTETLTWNVGRLNAGQTETMTLSGVVPLTSSEQELINQARIGNPEFPPPPVEEPCVPNDNLAGDDDQCDEVPTPVPPTSPDLKINKEAVGEPVISEDGKSAVITWMIETGNFGGRVAHDVVVTDVLPEGVEAGSVEVAAGPTLGEFDEESMVWTVGSLAAGQTASITFSAVVDTTAAEDGVFANKAYVENPEFPFDPEAPCVVNPDLPSDDDRCDLVETPITPDEPVDPTDPVDPEPVDPKDPVDPEPVDPKQPVAPQPPIDTGDPTGGVNTGLLFGGAGLLALAAGVLFFALRRKEEEESQELLNSSGTNK